LDKEQEFSHDIFKGFAAEKKKHGDKAGKALELLAPPPATPIHAASSSVQCPNTQYRFQANVEDQQLVVKLEEYLMQGKLSLTTPTHVFAASHTMRKNIAEKLKVRKVETNEYEAVLSKDPTARRTTLHEDSFDILQHYPTTVALKPAFCFPLQEIDILVNCSTKVSAILNTSSQINIIQQDIIQALGVHVNYHHLIEMEGANGATNWMVGCTENLILQVGDVSFKVHAHVVEYVSFSLLLGCPFQQTAFCCFEDLPSSEVEVLVRDPANVACRVCLSTRPHSGHAPTVKMISA